MYDGLAAILLELAEVANYMPAIQVYSQRSARKCIPWPAMAWFLILFLHLLERAVD